VAWAALRLGQRGTTLTIFAATAITIWDWSNGLGIATTKGDLESLLELQSFLCVLAVTGMTLVAITSERQKAEQLARGQAQALVKSIAFLTAAPDLDRFLEHVLRVMIEELRGSVGSYGYLTTRQRLFGFILNMSRAAFSLPLTLYILRESTYLARRKSCAIGPRQLGQNPLLQRGRSQDLLH
jgi:hypothetical protein